jgi:hypothetical protein
MISRSKFRCPYGTKARDHGNISTQQNLFYKTLHLYQKNFVLSTVGRMHAKIFVGTYEGIRNQDKLR